MQGSEGGSTAIMARGGLDGVAPLRLSTRRAVGRFQCLRVLALEGRPGSYLGRVLGWPKRLGYGDTESW